jgi:hypothetical protein
MILRNVGFVSHKSCYCDILGGGVYKAVQVATVKHLLRVVSDCRGEVSPDVFTLLLTPNSKSKTYQQLKDNKYDRAEVKRTRNKNY